MNSPVQQVLFDFPNLLQRTRTERLSARSGTFTDNMKLPVHRWFRYSAGFSADWAQQLILEHDPSSVLDPFAGSGTTLLAAAAAGVRATGYESHPFVARIAQAKTQWDCSEAKLMAAASELLAIASNDLASPLTPQPALLEKCYTPDVLRKLISIREAYLSCIDSLEPNVARLLWLAITAILRPCSFVGTAQWQYVLPSKRKAKTLDPIEALQAKIAEMIHDISVIRKSECRSDALVLLHDARDVPNSIEPGSIDLVVTSPPYPNNYDYADATRLEMTFWDEVRSWGDLQDVVRRYVIRSCSQHATAERLKLDPLIADPGVNAIRDDLAKVCNDLAEIRMTKGGRKAYHTMVAAYFCDLSMVFRALRTICSKGSTMCFVIGDSAPYGIYVPVDDWLGQLAVAAGFQSFEFEKLRDRNVKWKNRKHRVPLNEGRLWIKG